MVQKVLPETLIANFTIINANIAMSASNENVTL